jgi:hypothetical protein
MTQDQSRNEDCDLLGKMQVSKHRVIHMLLIKGLDLDTINSFAACVSVLELGAWSLLLSAYESKEDRQKAREDFKVIYNDVKNMAIEFAKLTKK